MRTQNVSVGFFPPSFEIANGTVSKKLWTDTHTQSSLKNYSHQLHFFSNTAVFQSVLALYQCFTSGQATAVQF